MSTEKVTLWCPTCQSGLGGFNEGNIYSIGDTCPMCLRKNRGERADRLVDVKVYEQDILNRAAYLKEQARKRATKGIESADVKVKKLQMEYEARIRKLEAKLDQKPKAKPGPKPKVKEVTDGQS